MAHPINQENPAAIAWVILDADERVVLICEGAGACTVAAEWAARGYRVETMAARELTAA